MGAKPESAAAWQHEFGLRLRELRKAAGLSQSKLALAADLDVTYISGVEQGRRNLGLVNICTLAHVLKVPVSELFPSQEPP